MNSFEQQVALEIKNIFVQNELSDLKRFLRKRQCINKCNTILIYLFHVVQSVGILTTTIAAGYDQKNLIWVGVALNVFASLITIFEKTNIGISKKLMKDIQSIKDGNYVDESTMDEPKKDGENGNEDKTNAKIDTNNDLKQSLLSV